MVLADDHGDTGSGPGHGADGRNEAERDNAGDQASSALAEDGLGGDLCHVEFSGERPRRRGMKKSGIETEVKGHDGKRARRQGQGNDPTWGADFTQDISRGIPSGIGVEREHE